MGSASSILLKCVFAAALVLSVATPTGLVTQAHRSRQARSFQQGTTKTRQAEVPAALQSVLQPLLPYSLRGSQARGSGLTLLPCTEDSICAAPRECIQVSEFGPESCDPTGPDAFCFCVPKDGFVFCTCSSECEDGEVCAHAPKKGVRKKICMSEFVATRPGGFTIVPPCNNEKPKPDPETGANNVQGEDGAAPNSLGQGSPGGSCIDASALVYLRKDELVFPTHRTAHVLCDQHNSCATPGHVVVFHDKAMMMRTYCKLVGCEARVIKVNSPSFRRALRVRSRTDGLAYTAFAARYETSAEEAIMAAAVRIGL